MPYATNLVVYHSRQAINDPKRPMLLQRMPRVKRYVFCELILLGSIEVLPRGKNGGNLMEWGLFLLPFLHGVFDT
jgi:hypothetical protein